MHLAPPWAKIIWTRISIPRHSLTTWMFMQQILPVLQRLGRYTQLPTTICGMCQQSTETQEHVFFECNYAKDIWGMLLTEWKALLQLTGMEACITSLTKLKMPRKIRALIYVMVNAVINNIWLARNRKLFNSKVYPAQDVLKEIKR